MMKKTNWLSKLKRFFFTSEKSSTQEKKRKWFFCGPKINELASVIIPPPLPLPLPSSRQLLQGKAHGETENLRRTIYEIAAIKIQTAFRGHLARKALRALKGLVKLQAIIRGRNVRRKAINTLKCLQSIVNIQTQVCARRSQSFEENFDYHEKATKIKSSNHVRWDDKIFTREESDAMFFNKKYHVNKPEMIKEHALGLQNSTDQENSKVREKSTRPWLEEWVDNQLAKMEDRELSTPLTSHNLVTRDFGRKRLNYSTYHQKHRLEGLVSPKYMAPTESTKAKVRSSSSPRTRNLSFDTYSERNNSPYKNKLAASEVSFVVTGSGRIMRSECDGLHCNSPSLKGNSGAVKSRRRAKNVSFDSECSMLNWDRYGLLK